MKIMHAIIATSLAAAGLGLGVSPALAGEHTARIDPATQESTIHVSASGFDNQLEHNVGVAHGGKVPSFWFSDRQQVAFNQLDRNQDGWLTPAERSVSNYASR